MSILSSFPCNLLSSEIEELRMLHNYTTPTQYFVTAQPTPTRYFVTAQPTPTQYIVTAQPTPTQYLVTAQTNPTLP